MRRATPSPGLLLSFEQPLPGLVHAPISLSGARSPDIEGQKGQGESGCKRIKLEKKGGKEAG